jgi:hypothetical protein
MTEQTIKAAHRRGMVVNGSVTDYHKSYEFFSRVLDPAEMGTGPDGRNYADPKLYIAHFHTKNMASALRNAAAALKAGIIRFESCFSGIGGQPANTVDGVTIEGREGDYYSDHFNHGLISTEDLVTMFHELGVDTGINQEMLIDLGQAFRTDVVDMFEAKQKKFGRPFMPCRSFMLTTGMLPKSVTQLYR